MSNGISDNLFYIEPFAECLNHVNWCRMLHFFQMLLLRLKAQVMTHFYESFVKWGASSRWVSSLYYLILLAEPPENWPRQKWPILGRGESGRSKSTGRSQSEHMCDQYQKNRFFFRLENFELFLAKINNKGQKWIGILLGHLF